MLGRATASAARAGVKRTAVTANGLKSSKLRLENANIAGAGLIRCAPILKYVYITTRRAPQRTAPPSAEMTATACAPAATAAGAVSGPRRRWRRAACRRARAAPGRTRSRRAAQGTCLDVAEDGPERDVRRRERASSRSRAPAPRHIPRLPPAAAARVVPAPETGWSGAGIRVSSFQVPVLRAVRIGHFSADCFSPSDTCRWCVGQGMGEGVTRQAA